MGLRTRIRYTGWVKFKTMPEEEQNRQRDEEKIAAGVQTMVANWTIKYRWNQLKAGGIKQGGGDRTSMGLGLP